MNPVAVFGASGRTGRLIVENALSRGIEVRALIRPPAQLDARPGLVVWCGSLDAPGDVEATLAGTAAVCCVFGPRKTSDAPFAARATAQVVSAMGTAGVRRIVCLTGAMVGELPPNVSLPMRVLAKLYRRQVPLLAADASEQERIAMNDALDWTIVKPPRLTNGRPSGNPHAGPEVHVGLLSRISRSSLAAFLVDEMEFARHVRKRVYVRG